ncbi:fasciclin domain-containing protein [Methanoculleus frigidifontis]|nr:fasciclin domain-containing protein [Methanoculleus sp. FWC-SCC1]
MKNIIETAEADGRFTKLLGVIREAGMEQTLAHEGPYTLFAPMDEAITGVSEAVFNEIMANRRNMTDILSYHVIAGKFVSNDLRVAESIKTLLGDHIDISEAGGAIQVNTATIVQPDIECSNGYIHVIDALLIPRAAEARTAKWI